MEEVGVSTCGTVSVNVGKRTLHLEALWYQENQNPAGVLQGKGQQSLKLNTGNQKIGYIKYI